MNPAATFFPAKRRVRRKRRAGLPPADIYSGPLEVLEVGDIDANPTGVAFTLTLNVNPAATLTDIASADPTQWTARYGGKTGSGEALEAVANNQLRVWIAFDNVQAGTNEFSFSADPEDIVDTQGRKLGAIEEREF